MVRQIRPLVTLGTVLVLLGIVCNEWLLSWLFSHDGRLQMSSRFFIWTFDIACCGAGYFFIKGATLQRFAKHYKDVALLFFSTSLLFLLLNVMVGAYLAVRQHDRPAVAWAGFFVDEYRSDLEKVYPGLNQDMI